MTGAWQGQTRVRRERRLTKVLLIAAALVFFCGLFGQIALRAQLSGQNKQLASLEKEIQALSANAANLDLSINQRHNLDEIGRKAILLGMEQPDESRLRVVSLPQVNGETSAQTVLNDGGEEKIG